VVGLARVFACACVPANEGLTAILMSRGKECQSQDSWIQRFGMWTLSMNVWVRLKERATAGPTHGMRRIGGGGVDLRSLEPGAKGEGAKVWECGAGGSSRSDGGPRLQSTCTEIAGEPSPVVHIRQGLVIWLEGPYVCILLD